PLLVWFGEYARESLRSGLCCAQRAMAYGWWLGEWRCERYRTGFQSGQQQLDKAYINASDQQRLRDEKFEGFERDSSCEADQQSRAPTPKASQSHIAPAQPTHAQ